MKTLRCVVAAAVAALVVMVADPADAKGPVAASIEGPGLEAPIEVPDVGMSKLPDLTGLYSALWAEPASPLVDKAPTTDLGPAWVITWDMGTSADANLVRQTLYPEAEGGPLVHTKGDQPFVDRATTAGWYKADPALADMLRHLGIPADHEAVAPADAMPKAAAKPASSTRPRDTSSSDGTSTWIMAAAGAAALVALVAGPLVLVRRRSPRLNRG